MTIKQAQYLRVGDVLQSGPKVIREAQVGLNTPKGKCDLVVEYPSGRRVLKIWNKRTEIAII